MDANKIFVDMARQAREFAEMCDRVANETKQKADPEAWREEYRKKQAAGVKFERRRSGGEWMAPTNYFDFSGNKEDYREVPQKTVDVNIPEASREILKQWQKLCLRIDVDGICGDKRAWKFDNGSARSYSIPEQPIPEGMSVEAVEAIWRQGLKVEFDEPYGGQGWTEIGDTFTWSGDRVTYKGAELLKRLRIPAQPIPEKMLEEPQEISIADKLAFTENNVPQEPHAAERALWKAQREAGTDEVWKWENMKGNWLDLLPNEEPQWMPGHKYRVKPKPVKLTAKIMGWAFGSKTQEWEFFGTPDEYRAECEKYGYAVVSEINEVVEKPKTVKRYMAMLKYKTDPPFSCVMDSCHTITLYATREGYNIIGIIEEREVPIE